eukprot:7906056-Prorocentrum_lima.AAC.1
MTSSLVGSEMCIRDSSYVVGGDVEAAHHCQRRKEHDDEGHDSQQRKRGGQLKKPCHASRPCGWRRKHHYREESGE